MFKVMNEFKRAEIPKQKIEKDINIINTQENNTISSNTGPQFFM